MIFCFCKFINLPNLLLTGDCYNVSEDSTDISVYGFPFPFETRPLPGYPTGFPVVIESTLVQASAKRELDFLKLGNFVDEFTSGIKTRVICYNAALQVFG